MKKKHFYAAYGLNICSTIPLPELIHGDSKARVDVAIRIGKIARLKSHLTGEKEFFRVNIKKAYLYWEKVGTFLVRNGSEIIVDPVAETGEDVLRVFILGVGLAVLFYQRGCLVLHGSAVEMDGSAVAFLGGSGSGKSTLAASIYNAGYCIVTDDVIAVHLDDDFPIVYPGFPRLKLWPDAIVRLGDDPEKIRRINSRVEKRSYRITSGFTTVSLPLRYIYILAEDNSQKIESIRGREAVMELVRYTYAVQRIQKIESPSHFLQCANLANHIILRRLKISRSPSALDDAARLVEEDVLNW